MDDKKRTYIDYDVETDNIIYIEEEKEKIELPDEITEEDLKEQQIKSVIKDEALSNEEDYYDGNNDITQEVMEILNKINSEADNIDYDYEKERLMQMQQEELEKRYKQKKEFISKDETLKTEYSFEKEVPKNARDRKSILDVIFSIFNKGNQKKAAKKKQQIKITDIQKKAEEKKEEPQKIEVSKSVEDESKPAYNFGKDMKKFATIIVFAVIFIFTVRELFFKDQIKPVDNNSNNNKTITEQKKDNSEYKGTIDTASQSEFLNYMEKVDAVIEGMIIITNDEIATLSKYANNQISKEELGTFFKQSKSKKEQLDRYFSDTKISKDLDELNKLVQRRIRESINISKTVLFYLNTGGKKSDILGDVNKYIDLDTSLAEKQQEETIKLYKAYNIKYEKEGQILDISGQTW